MLFVDEDVWNSRLAGLFMEVGLDLTAVRCFVELLDVDLVLQIGEFGSEEGLGSPAVWAVGLGENDDLVASNGIVDELFGSHVCRRRGCKTGEESSHSAGFVSALYKLSS